VIERFASDMAPYAAGLAQQLAQQFWRIVSAGEGGDDDGDDGGDDGAALRARCGASSSRGAKLLWSFCGCLRLLCTAPPSIQPGFSLSHFHPTLQACWLPMACCVR
jgi:hypothetical protein